MAERDKTILARAKKRFQECTSWESAFRQRFKEDMRFLYADSDNQDQWNASVRAGRNLAGQVMVTINKTHTHWLHVVNQVKMNRPQVSVSPTGDQSTYESAQILEQVIRRIEYISDAETAYDIATQFMVGGGIGYWRVVTDYTDQDSFDQDIFIRQVPDPLAVYLDPNIKMQDGSDAKFAFIFDEMPRKDAEAKYGKLAQMSTSLGDAAENWMKTDSVRIAEYYERSETKEWLYAIPADDGSMTLARESELGQDGARMLKQEYEQREDVMRRRVPKYSVVHHLIVGDSIAETSIWPGKYIPIVRCVGEEIVMDGRLDRKGLTRYLKDPQRAYNYNASAALEYGALQSKSPYLAPVEAIEGLEDFWATANSQNHAYLPYNHADESGNPVPAPVRQPAPTGATVFIEGMQTAEHEMMMASGQYEATFSAQGNEISGRSIEQRQKQGERVTFHYPDALAKSIRFTGKIILDLIPKIYDTKRVIRIMSESGTEQAIEIDPQAKQALQQHEQEQDAKVQAVFNPNVGQYDVVATAGPNYETRRKEAFAAMTDLLAGNMSLAPVIGDLYMGAADFPNADELQERMRNWIAGMNPGIMGNGPSPQEQQLMQHNQLLMQELTRMKAELDDKTIQRQLEQKRVDMDALNHLALRMENDNKQVQLAYDSITKRLQAMAPMMSEDALEPIIRKMIGEALTAYNPDAGVQPDSADPANVYAHGIDSVLQPIDALKEAEVKSANQPQAAPQQ
jgi:hypothetical protein